MLKKFVSSVFKSGQIKEIEAQVENVLLSKVPFLRDADPSLIADVVAAVEPVEYKNGDTIFSEGDRGDSFFLIVDGAVRISCKGEFIAALGVGGCFGEGALIEGAVRGATIVVSEDVTLFQFNSEAFVKLTEKHSIVKFRMGELHQNRRAESIEKSIEHNLLKNAPFLSGAGGDLISELARYLEPKSYAKGDVLIREGSQGTSFFLIEEGMVSISKASNQVAELGAGACLGEGSLSNQTICSATVTALVDTSCFVLGKSAFNRIIGRYPVFGRRLLELHDQRA